MNKILRNSSGQKLEGGDVLVQLGIGDLYRLVQFPWSEEFEAIDWRKGEPRARLDAAVLGMCREILDHGTIWRCFEGCKRDAPIWGPCPDCNAPKLQVVE